MHFVTHCRLSHEIFKQGAAIVRSSLSQEIALTFGIKPTTGTSVTASSFEKLNKQTQSARQVIFSQSSIDSAAHKLEKKGESHAGLGHSHIEANNHAHGLSQADKDHITEQVDDTKAQLYPLFFLRKDNTVDLKMYNNNHEEVDITIGGETTKTVSLTKDGEYKMAA